jgi:hypothetical protein
MVSIVSISSILFLSAFANGIMNNEANVNIAKTSDIPIVSLNSNSHVKLKDAAILSTGKNKIVKYTIEFYNGGNTNIDFIDYWARIKSSKGNNFSVKLLSSDVKKNSIAPDSVQNYTFFATVSNSVTLSDLTLELIKWDFSVPSFQSKIGEIQIPADYSFVVPASGTKELDVDGNTIITQIDNQTINHSGDYNVVNIAFSIKNNGSQSVTVPGYNYYVMTKDGLIYKLETTDLENKLIQPKFTKKINFNTTLPSEIDTKDMDLFITQTDEQTKVDVPVVFYKLPLPKEEQNSTLGKSIPVTIKKANYSIILNSIQRMPWGDEDILVAYLSVFNGDTKVNPIPELTGTFSFDGVQSGTKNTAALNLNNGLAIQPNQSVALTMHIKIPYTYDFKNIELQIAEKVDDTKNTNLVKFSTPLVNLKYPKIRLNSAYKLNHTGKRAEIKLLNSYVYENKESQIYYSELEATNLEKRFTNFVAMEGYLKTEDDVYYPATIHKVTDKVSPGGKVLLNFWSKLPLSIDTSKLTLLIGEGVKGQNLASAAEEKDAYVKAVTMELPLPDLNTNISPYKMTVSTITGSVNLNQKDTQNLTVNYELLKKNFYESFPKGHKIALELTNQQDPPPSIKEFDIETELKTGKNKLEYTTNAPFTSIFTYKINVYDVFEGHQRLISTHPITWSIIE